MKRKTYKNQTKHQHLGLNNKPCGMEHYLLDKHTKTSTIVFHNACSGKRHQQTAAKIEVIEAPDKLEPAAEAVIVI